METHQSARSEGSRHLIMWKRGSSEIGFLLGDTPRSVRRDTTVMVLKQVQWRFESKTFQMFASMCRSGSIAESQSLITKFGHLWCGCTYWLSFHTILCKASINVAAGHYEMFDLFTKVPLQVNLPQTSISSGSFPLYFSCLVSSLFLSGMASTITTRL